MYCRFYFVLLQLFMVAAFASAQDSPKASGVPADNAAKSADTNQADTNQTGVKPFMMPPAKGESSPQNTGVANTPVPSSYILGPGDQVSLLVADLSDEFSDKIFRIDLTGDLNLPLVGRVHAAGQTLDQLEAQVAARLKKAVKDPDVVITIASFGSQTVSVLGAVGTPGPHQLEGRKNLSEILALAGGLRVDSGSTINITRDMRWGRIPLADSLIDPTGKFSVVSIKARTLINASSPAENILIMPGDVVTVPVAEKVYAVGALGKPGAYLLDQHDSISALQVLSLSEGFGKAAAPNRAKILRVVPGSPNRAEIAVNLKEILKGKTADVELRSDDILYVPTSGGKIAANRTLDAVIIATTSTAVLGRF